MIWRLLVALHVVGVAPIARGFLFPSKGASTLQSKLYAQNNENKAESRSIVQEIQQRALPIFTQAISVALLTVSLQQSVEAATVTDATSNPPVITSSTSSKGEELPVFDAVKWFEEKSTSGSKLLTTTVRNDAINEQIANTRKSFKPFLTTIEESFSSIQTPQLTLPSADITLNPNTIASLLRSLPSQWPSLIPIIGAVFFADQLQANEQLKVTIAEYEGAMDGLKRALNESELRNSFTNSTILQLEQSTLTWQQEIAKLDVELTKRASEVSDLRSSLKGLELARVTENDLKLKNDQLQLEVTSLINQLSIAPKTSSFSSSEKSQISTSKSQVEVENEKLKTREVEVLQALRGFLVSKGVMSQGIANLLTPQTITPMLSRLQSQSNMIFGPDYTAALEQEVKLLQYKYESKNGVLTQELRKKDDILDGSIAKVAALEEALQKAEKEKIALISSLKKAEAAAAASAAVPLPAQAKAAAADKKEAAEKTTAAAKSEPAAVKAAPEPVKKEMKPVIVPTVIPPVDDSSTPPPPPPPPAAATTTATTAAAAAAAAVSEKKKTTTTAKPKKTTADSKKKEEQKAAGQSELVVKPEETGIASPAKPKRGTKPGAMKKAPTAATAAPAAVTEEEEEKKKKSTTTAKKAPASAATKGKEEKEPKKSDDTAAKAPSKAAAPKKKEAAAPPPSAPTTTTDDSATSSTNGSSKPSSPSPSSLSAQQMKEAAMARAKQKAEALRASADSTTTTTTTSSNSSSSSSKR